MQNWQLRDDEWVQILPQFLGTAFAFSLFAVVLDKPNLAILSALVLFFLILRFRFLFFVGNLMQDTLFLLGRYLVFAVLGSLYLTLISAYAALIRLCSRTLRRKFTTDRDQTTTFVTRNHSYQPAEFEKPW